MSDYDQEAERTLRAVGCFLVYVLVCAVAAICWLLLDAVLPTISS